MPATSRSGERLQPPLGQRPRRLALEVEDHPAAVGEHGLAEVVVAVGADHAAAGADVRERLQPLAHVLAAPGDRRERVGAPAGRGTRARSARRRPRSAATSASALGSSGANAGFAVVRAERRVQLAGHLRRARAAGRAARPGRRRARRARAPSRRARRPGTPAGSRASRRSGGPRPRTSRPAAAMCGKPRADRKRSSSSSGFTPGSTRRNAFRISCSPNTIDEFDCSTPTGRTSTVPPTPGAGATPPSGSAACPPRPRRSRRARMRCSSSRPCAGSASAS